jgi:hypothetical protein
MTLYEAWWSAGPFTVLLDKHASIWTYRVRNGVDGSSGSTHRGSLAMAECLALRGMPIGTAYRLIVNGKDRGEYVRGDGAHSAKVTSAGKAA